MRNSVYRGHQTSSLGELGREGTSTDERDAKTFKATVHSFPSFWLMYAYDAQLFPPDHPV